MREGDESWQEVPAHRSKGKRSNNNEAKGNKDVAKFFVSNLPNGCTPWDISEFLGYYGEVVGSYIARKRDREGKRFGFITFRKVRNVEELERNMNGVKMGTSKLKVNVAKFAAENIGIWQAEGQHNKVPERQQCRAHEKQASRAPEKQEEFRQHRENDNRLLQDNRKSFRDAFSGNIHASASVQMESSRTIVQIPDNIVAFSEIHGRALVGRVVDLKTLMILDKLLVDEGFAGLEIIYIGGLSLILKFHDREDAVELVLKVETWRKWFTVLDVWDGQVLPFERVAWLKIHGVPINLAANEVFDSIAGQFGKVIQPSQLCLEDGDLSVDYVGVLVGDGAKINDSVTLKWKDKLFKTWVSEEPGKWVPDCVGLVEVIRSDVDSDSPEKDGLSSPDPVQSSEPESGRQEAERPDVLMEEGEFRCREQEPDGDRPELFEENQKVNTLEAVNINGNLYEDGIENYNN